jgi:hypothetical protein
MEFSLVERRYRLQHGDIVLSSIRQRKSSGQTSDVRDELPCCFQNI